MNRRPSIAWRNVARSDDGVRTCGRRTVSVLATSAAVAKEAAATTYGTVASTAYRKPLTAGPTIRPNCHVPEYSAISRGNPLSGAMSGGTARNDGAANARAVPNSTAMVKIGTTDVGFVAA